MSNYEHSKILVMNMDHMFIKSQSNIKFSVKTYKNISSTVTVYRFGWKIGLNQKFSSLNPLDMNEYISFVNTQDWQKIDSNVNNFETEHKWRLVFFNGDGFNRLTNEPFNAIEKKHFII